MKRLLLPLFLVALWLLLESLSRGDILLAILLALGITRAITRLRPLPAWPRRFWRSLQLIGWVFCDIVCSNIAVGGLILEHAPTTAAQRFHGHSSELRNPHGLAMLSIIITSTPGTVRAAHDPQRNVFTMHVPSISIDIAENAPGGAPSANATVKPLMRICSNAILLAINFALFCLRFADLPSAAHYGIRRGARPTIGGRCRHPSYHHPTRGHPFVGGIIFISPADCPNGLCRFRRPWLTLLRGEVICFPMLIACPSGAARHGVCWAWWRYPTLLDRFGPGAPEGFCALHAPTMGSTLGTYRVLAASLLISSTLAQRLVIHEVLIALLILMTAPVTTMILMSAALRRTRK